MKKIALLLVLSLILVVALVACGGNKNKGNETETEPYMDLQTNSTEWETFSDEPEDGNDVLGVGADTDDSWGPIQRN